MVPANEQISGNPYWGALRDWPTVPDGERSAGFHLLFPPAPGGRSRDELCRRFAWAIPSPQAVHALRRVLARRGLVEIGAGTGYWAALLAHAGVDVRGYDTAPPALGANRWHCPLHTVWREPTEVEAARAEERADSLRAVMDMLGRDRPQLTAGLDAISSEPTRQRQFRDPSGQPGPQYFPLTVGGSEVLAEDDNADRVLLLCWPPYDDPMAHDALHAYRSDLLIYVGEGYGGCTADDGFFDLLERDWSEVARMDIPHWAGIHDYLTIFRRDVPRRSWGARLPAALER
jgi:hypothetical protein